MLILGRYIQDDTVVVVIVVESSVFNLSNLHYMM